MGAHRERDPQSVPGTRTARRDDRRDGLTAVERVVVLRPLGLGDFLTGVPAYRAIANAFPNARRILAVPAPLHGLADLCGAFDAAVDVEPLHALPAELEHADVAIDLHGRGPASHRILLAAHPRRLVAFENPEIPGSFGNAQWFPREHEVVRWCRMLRAAGIPADERRLDLPEPAWDVPAHLRGASIVHPGAASGSRRWPIERWARVVRALIARGEAVLVTGGPGETDLVEELAMRADLAPSRAVAGALSLVEFAALVARAGRVICGDTGVAHLATAYRRPSIVLFGPTSPEEWGPPPDRSEHVVLWRGRTGDPHGTSIDPGLLDIQADDVIAAIDGQSPAFAAAEPAR